MVFAMRKKKHRNIHTRRTTVQKRLLSEFEDDDRMRKYLI